MSDNELGFDDGFMATMLGDFLDESQGYLSCLSENLLVLDELVREAGADAPHVELDLLNEMFRSAHSLKGLSAMLQLGDINALTHRIENVFDAARQRTLPITADVVEVMFEAFDLLAAMVGVLHDPHPGRIEAGRVHQTIERILAGSIGPTAEAAATTAGVAESDETWSGDRAPGGRPAEQEMTDPLPTGDPITEDQRKDVPMAGSSIGSSESTVDFETEAFRNLKDETEVVDKYLSIFIDETEDSLDSVSDTLLQNPEAVRAEDLLVVCHRIKGGAASIGLARPARLAHQMEDILQDLLERQQPVDSQLAESLLFAVDALRAYLENLKDGGSQPDQLCEAFQCLQRGSRAASGGEREEQPSPAVDVADPLPTAADSLQGASEGSEAGGSALPCSGPAPADAPWAAGLREQLPDALAFAGAVLAGRVRFEPDLPLSSLKAVKVLERLNAAGIVFASQPTAAEAEACDEVQELVFGLFAERDLETIDQSLRVDGVMEVEWVTLHGEVPAIEGRASDVSASEVSASEVSAGEASVDGGSAATKRLPATVCDGASSAPSRPAPSPGASPAPDAAGECNREVERPISSQPAASPSPVQQGSRIASPAASAPAAGPGEPLREAKLDPKLPANRTAAGRPAETLRVDIDRLDQLMNLAGQLVINKARFGQIGEQLKGLASLKQSTHSMANVTAALERLKSSADEAGRKGGGPRELQTIGLQVNQIQADMETIRRDIDQLARARGLVNDLAEAVHQLDRVADEIQKSVMDTRMLPIGPLFGRFKRVVRDVTRSNGKDVRLVIRGEKTELDKRMIDELGDPLIHMVRNSADHGVESPESRLAAGKPRQGTITLDAFHRGNRIFIQVKDDGQGLNPERIRAKAVAKGIVTAVDAERMSHQQIYQLIWEPGFSTAEKVTEVSGRGMGMDIVRAKIEQLNGTVEIDSEVGRGVTITIKLPLTMAILPSLLTEIDGDVFAIPVESVIEIVRVDQTDLGTVHGMRTARVRGRVVSVVQLSDLFEGYHESGPAEATGCTLVIVGSDGNELGLSVHSLLGEQDIVIKSLAENYRNVEGVAGASILGDGRVSLILDVGALLSLSCHPPRRGRQAAGAAQASPQDRSSPGTAVTPTISTSA